MKSIAVFIQTFPDVLWYLQFSQTHIDNLFCEFYSVFGFKFFHKTMSVIFNSSCWPAKFICYFFVGHRLTDEEFNDFGFHFCQGVEPDDLPVFFDNEIIRLYPLTKVETKIVKLLVGKSMTNKEVADEIGNSVRTVENHRHRLMKKLKTRNAIELTKKIINMGLAKL